jgi:hypothetical protein
VIRPLERPATASSRRLARDTRRGATIPASQADSPSNKAASPGSQGGYTGPQGGYLGPQGGYPGQYGYGPAAGPSNNPLAVGALIASLCGLLPFIGLFGAIAGVVMGVIARRQIRYSNGMQGGDGLAIAGIVIGAVLIIFAIFVILVIVGVVSHTNS